MAKPTRSYELQEAMSRLIVQQPFFAVIMLDLLTIEEGGRVPTAATDGKRIYVNPCFFNPLPIEERVGVLIHEVLHVILLHCPRMRLYQDRGFGPDLNPFSNAKWNHATDYIINDWIHEAKLGKIPVGGLFHPNFGKADLADDVYLKIPEPPEQDGGGGGGGTPEGGDGSGNWDVHLPSPTDAPTTAEVQRAVQGAANAAKNMGRMPAGMERLVADLCEPQVHWSDRLRLSVLRTAGRDTNTWAKPHRRRLATAPQVYWPGRTGYGAGTIVMYEDTSGSVSPNELKHFRSEMAGLFDEITPEQLFIGSCDARAYDPVLVEDAQDIISHKAEGGGGTHMPAIFEKLKEHDIRPDTLVILTDGFTDFGEDPGYPVIWIMTSDREAPFGENIKIEVSE